jgi:ATP-dependent exoDNAse (exonuclease V) beta subunit
LQSLEKQHAVAEFCRLLYVGATRARDHLVVSLYHNSRQKESAAAQLIRAGALEEAAEMELAPSTAQRRQPFAGLEVDLPTDAEREDLAAQRDALVAGARRRWYTSATAIKAAGGGFAQDSTDEQPERSDDTEPWSRGRARTRLGRAVHATIQSLPLDANEAAIAAFSRAQAVAEAVPHLGPEAEELVRWIVKRSEAWQRATSATRALREVPFALETDGKVLEGFIDLVIETPAGLEIVDWKTDHITAGEVSGRLREYELQAGLYVYGLREATGLPVSRVTYVFASARVEMSPGTPGELEAAARTRLAAARP